MAKQCRPLDKNHERAPHHSASWEGWGYSSSPKVASTVGSFHGSITDPACYQQRITLFQLLPVSQDLKEYLSYHTTPGP